LDLEEANEQIEKQRDLLVHSERMAALGRVAAAISHEIQGPLVPIGGFARAMRRDVDDASPHAEMLDFIVEEVDRLQRVVKGVTSLASMPLPQLQPVSFAGLVETTYAVYGPKAHARGISLDMDVPNDIPDPDIDDDQWHEVLLNLVSNAIEATLNGGRILTSLRLRENRYVVTVTDTGAGVPPEEIPKAFAAFFSTQPVAHGAGLNIVAAIVQRHFGRVTVESGVGKGTSVKIDFPAADELHRLVNAARSTMTENQDIATLDPLTVTTFKLSS
jgi:signal transduction histidine kinase